MEYIHGLKITDIEGLRKAKINIPKISRIFLEIFAEQIFIRGFVHCDPHPGNVFVRKMPNGTDEVVLLDHGLYKELSEELRINYCHLWKAMILKNDEDVIKYCAKLGITTNWELFATSLLMRNYKDNLSVLTMSESERRKFITEMRNRIVDVVKVMRQMPSGLLLILRNNNLVRFVNRELGNYANRYMIMGSKAAQGIEVLQSSNGFWSQVQRWKNSFIFEFMLRLGALQYWFQDVSLYFYEKFSSNVSLKELEKEILL